MAKTEVVRHKENPFLANGSLTVPVGRQSVKIGRLGVDDTVLMNRHTGEVEGTHVISYKRVDKEEFVKLFTANISMTFGLNAAGIKAFGVLMWAVQRKGIDRDQVPLDKWTLIEFQEDMQLQGKKVKLSQPTLWRGLAELEKSQIIAKTLRQGRYFINPNLIFNGDRLAFTQVIERKRKGEDQQELDLDAPPSEQIP